MARTRPVGVPVVGEVAIVETAVGTAGAPGGVLIPIVSDAVMGMAVGEKRFVPFVVAGGALDVGVLQQVDEATGGSLTRIGSLSTNIAPGAGG